MSRVAQMALLGSAAPPAAAISYVGLTTLADTGAAQSVAGVSVGAAAYNRTVVMIVHWYNPTSVKALSSATIGGVAATIHAQNTGVGGSAAKTGCAIISAFLPAGTTATVTLDFVAGAAYYHAYLETYRVVGLISAVAIDAISTAVSAVNTFNGTIDVLEDGVLLMGGTLFAAVSYSFSGVTENYESTIFTDQRITGASLATTADETNRAVSITRSGGTAMYGPIVGASFR